MQIPTLGSLRYVATTILFVVIVVIENVDVMISYGQNYAYSLLHNHSVVAICNY